MKKTNQTLKPVGSFFAKKSSQLNRLYNKARRLEDLQGIVRELLSDAVSPHVRIATYRDGSLHLYADNAHWATRLRYMESELIASLRKFDAFSHLKTVQYSVKPLYTPPSYKNTARAISEDNARHISTVAKYIGDDALRKALIKLSHAKPSND
jgi:hypothetical protein